MEVEKKSITDRTLPKPTRHRGVDDLSSEKKYVAELEDKKGCYYEVNKARESFQKEGW